MVQRRIEQGVRTRSLTFDVDYYANFSNPLNPVS